VGTQIGRSGRGDVFSVGLQLRMKTKDLEGTVDRGSDRLPNGKNFSKILHAYSHAENRSDETYEMHRAQPAHHVWQPNSSAADASIGDDLRLSTKTGVYRCD